MRKWKFPIKLSVVPLFLLLVLGTLRMFLVIEFPNSITILSETIYPIFINFARLEFLPYQIFGLPVNVFNAFVCVWIIVAAVLIVKTIIEIIHFGSRVSGISKWPRDEYAESLLKEIIGTDKEVYVFRSSTATMAFTTAFKPYIVLPNAQLSDDTLRVTLLHEWKHIDGKDILIRYIVDIICCVFWWNLPVYILKKNFSFAGELNADMYSTPNKNDFGHYLESTRQLLKYREKKVRSWSGKETDPDDATVGINSEGIERMRILALRYKACIKKGKLANIIFSIAICILFAVSYMFVFRPAFWESPDVLIVAASFTDEYQKDGGIFRIEETFVVDNEDGTFSLYIDGQFVRYMTDRTGHFYLFPLRERE